MKKYIKSPFNYIGNKYKLLSQILPIFPKKIDKFYDIFCGGLDVSVNVTANKKIANDINYFVIEILEMFKNLENEKLIKNINKVIKKYELSKDNKDGYLKLRNDYNHNPNPLLLYTLVCFSFNYQFRFNNELKYNNPAGTGRSHFNKNLENRIKLFQSKLGNIEFNKENFKNFNYNIININDFVYFDPPYRASTGSYNDGKRGFEGWNLEDDLVLFDIIDKLNKKNIKFALSNVFSNNGQKNIELEEWSKKYKINYLDISYNNSNYRRKQKGETKEVLITNY